MSVLPAGAGGDPALETLFLPFEQGLLPWPDTGEVAFLRARAGWPLKRRGIERFRCEQGFRPFADRLEAEGLAVHAELGGEYPLVLVLPPRQRIEARALLARALALAGSAGSVVCAMPNTEGARTGEDDLARLAGHVGSLSKHKCRVFWSTPAQRRLDQARLDQALCAEWAALDAPRAILDGRYTSRPGVFAWDRIDAASALLADSLPVDLAGHAADFGAGWGYLADALLARCAGITSVDLYEAEARALALARTNLATARCPVAYHWHDVTRGVAGRYDLVLSNPPFHQGRADQPEIGRAFIAAAAGALRPQGRLWMVANRHLPYEATLAAHFERVREVRADAGFKVFEAIRGNR